MTTFYSPSTRGFYLDDIHDSIPEDAVEITPEQHEALLAAQAQGLEISCAGGVPTAQPKTLTQDQLKAQLSAAVQAKLDDAAKALGYDDIKSAVTYADEPAVPKFQAEGKALRAWRSRVWAACYAILADVEAGRRPAPTKAQLLAELPAFGGAA